MGHTRTTIKERFKEHDSIKKYYSTVYGINIGQEIISTVMVIERTVDKFEVCILGALLNKTIQLPTVNLMIITLHEEYFAQEVVSVAQEVVSVAQEVVQCCSRGCRVQMVVWCNQPP